MNVAEEAPKIPYPGLRPFEAKDQTLFFGREEQVAGVLSCLEDHCFVAVVGSSGCGKSSLLRAGVLPAVHNGFLPGAAMWRTILVRPGRQPYRNLVVALSRAADDTRGNVLPCGIDDATLRDTELALLAALRRSDRGLLNILDESELHSEGVIIVIDQFEELFAFRRAAAKGNAHVTRDEAAAFVNMLLESAAESSRRVKVIITIRSDFIGDCEAFFGLPERVSKTQFLVPRLDRWQMKEAIEGPASVDDADYRSFRFEPGLVTRIINDAGDRLDQLPLMQHALMCTWKSCVQKMKSSGQVPTMTAQDYLEVGGIDKALSQHADAAYSSLGDPELEAVARRLFLLLCDVASDGQITRRGPKVSELQSVTKATLDDISCVVRVFREDDRNFIVVHPDGELTAESYFDISHEALLRQWPRFTNVWLSEEGADAAELRRLAETVALRRSGQKKAGLLAEEDLSRVTTWQKRISAEWAQRYVEKEAWQDINCYITESRNEIERVQRERMSEIRKKKQWAFGVGIFLLVAAAICLWQALQANDARRSAERSGRSALEGRRAAQDALVRSFAHSIGVSNFLTATEDEGAALWDLSELESENADVRVKVIDGWLSNRQSAEKGFRRLSQGLHSAVGFDVKLRDKVSARVPALAKKLVSESDSLGPQGADVESYIAELVEWISPADVKKLIEDLSLPALAYRNHDVAAIFVEDLAPKISGRDAVTLASNVTKYLLQNPSNDTALLENLERSLVALAPRLEAEDAVMIANDLLSILAEAEASDGRLGLVCRVLAVLPHKWNHQEVARVFTDQTERFLQLIDKADPALSAFLTLIPKLTEEIEQGKTTEIIAPKALALAKGLAKHQNEDLTIFCSAALVLGKMASKCDQESATAILMPSVAALANKLDASNDVTERIYIGKHLFPLMSFVPRREADAIATRGGKAFANVLKEGVTTDSRELGECGELASQFAAKMNVEDSKELAYSLTEALSSPRVNSREQLVNIRLVLTQLSGQLSRQNAAAVASKMAADFQTRYVKKLGVASTKKTRLQSSEGGDANWARLRELARGLAALSRSSENAIASPLLNESAQTVVAHLEESLQLGDNYVGLPDVGAALAALVAPLEPKVATRFALRGASPILARLQDPNLDDNERLKLETALGQLALCIPRARTCRLQVMSQILSKVAVNKAKPWHDKTEDIKLRQDMCAQLDMNELTEVLKWPFCVGDVRKEVLAALGKRNNVELQGNLWKLVEQESLLGMRNVHSPAKRPTLRQSIKEIDNLTRENSN